MGKLSGKKGISVMIGYVLLVTLAIVMSTIVFQYMESYVPSDDIECNEGVSLQIKDVEYDCANPDYLNLTIRNNGRFSVAGYYIHATNSSSQELATKDLSPFTNQEKSLGAVLFSSAGSSNNYVPQSESFHNYSLSDSNFGKIYNIEIIPARYEEIKGRTRFVSCGNTKIYEVVCEGGAPPECGNNNKEEGELCDGTDLGGATCESLMGEGYTGTVSCSPDCQSYDTSGCTSGPTYTLVDYSGFEDPLGLNGWTTSGLAQRQSSSPSQSSKVDKDGNIDGGSYSVEIRGSPSSISKTKDLSGYDSINISWWGYYSGLNQNEDCVELIIDDLSPAEYTFCKSDIDNDESISQDEWIHQHHILTSGLTSSNQIKFVVATPSTNDYFYIDGINITGIS